MRLTCSILTVSLLVAAACTTNAHRRPEIVVDRTACNHCGMLISEPIYAAAYQAPGSEVRVFDDIGCLIQAAQKEASAGLRFWFHDGLDGEWIEDAAPRFVASPEIRTPMGGGILAYRDIAAAEQAAGRHRGKVVGSLSELLNRKGDEK